MVSEKPTWWCKEIAEDHTLVQNNEAERDSPERDRTGGDIFPKRPPNPSQTIPQNTD